jgi:hypothetical protein
MADRWNTTDDDISPLRKEQRQRVREELEARLDADGVKLHGSESDGQIIALSNALESFDVARQRVGGDSMVNTAESSRPDDPRLVVPARRDDESVDQYIGRIHEATRRLADDVKHG